MKKYNVLFLIAGLFALNSCVDADIDDALEYEDTYTNMEDADKHILGVYSKFMELAEQMVVLNELRADLMTITDNSNTYLQEVDANVDNADNPYLQPTKYYAVINECNDCLDNFDKMLVRHDLTEDEYAERYSDIAALRTYVYLQAAVQFGKIPYITKPIVTVKDMNEAYASAPRYGLDELLPKLIATMESLPFMNPYEESPLVINTVSGSSSKTTVDGQLLYFYFIHKKLLLADLYLWNNQYREAATLYKEFLDQDSKLAETNNYLRYKCTSSGTISTEGAYGNYYQAYFLRYNDANVNANFTSWPNMFSDLMSTKAADAEWIWTITFPSGDEPAYPFVDLFASTSDGGSYQLRPSSACIYNYNRSDLLRTNDAPYDPRGEGATFNENNANSDTVCAKYLGLFDPSQSYVQEGRWWLYRSAMVLLRFAECMNRLGYPEFAWNFVTKGIAGTYGTSYPSGITLNGKTDEYGVLLPTSNPAYFRGQGQILDVLYPITMGITDNEADSALLYFDSRFYSSASPNPFDGYSVRGGWRENRGLRVGRQCMSYYDNLDADLAGRYADLSDCPTKQDSIYLVEKLIMDEASRELAHEGNRFPDLIRAARRMDAQGNDGMSGGAYLQALINRKNQGRNNVLGNADYTSSDNWYLKWH